MAISVKIDFENLYEIEHISEDLRISTFKTELEDGSYLPLKVEISNECHTLLPNVYNLAFGPLDKKGEINDKAQLSHKDYSRVFSTILFDGLNFLNNNKGHYLGIDGSDNARAYMYYMFLQRNYDYLSKYFNIYGLKYYVRITRFGKNQYDNPFDFADIHPVPDRILKGSRLPPPVMYNYFIFNSKNAE
jgi:hypothetical protein